MMMNAIYLRLMCVMVAGFLMMGVFAAHGEHPLSEGEGSVDILVVTNAGTWRGEIQAGIGYRAGEAIYSIGGQAWAPEYGTVNFPEKVSELTFPYDVVYGSVEGRFILDQKAEIFAMVMGNISQPSTKVTDSDWGVLSDSELDIYSESDTELSSFVGEVGVLYWLNSKTAPYEQGWSIGVGPALYYEQMDWTVSNIDQWYPSNPELEHDYRAGDVATYNVEIMMPYFDVTVVARYWRASCRAEMGVGPAFVKDEDDHLLRQKKMAGDMTGIGVKTEADFRYDFTEAWFGLVNVTALAIGASGTQTQEGYGGELEGFYAEIDEEFSLGTFSGGVAVGYRF
jgi:hypothetical protein